MAIRKQPNRILVISKTPKMTDFLKEALPADICRDMLWVSSVGEAKRVLTRTSFSIVVINTPLEDDFGVESGIDISEQHHVGVLLLVKNDIYEQVAYKAEAYGVLTLTKTTTKQTLYMAVRMLGAMQAKLHRMEMEALNLKQKMNEMRMIDRAKWLLVDQLKMSEPEAHRYIEKQAMDRCVKRLEIAENIIKTYEH